MRRELLNGVGARRSRRVIILSNVSTEFAPSSLGWYLICFDEAFDVGSLSLVVAQLSLSIFKRRRSVLLAVAVVTI